MSGLTLYRGICRVCFVGFAATFVAMLLAPSHLAWFVNATAATVGLSGSVAVGSGDASFVLGLSYLATLMVLAGTCATRPKQSELFWTLVTGLSVAAVGFVFMALADGGAWLVGTGVLGGLAATLIGTRVQADRSMRSAG